MPKIYFISDLHLGAPNKQSSLERERRFVLWLEQIKSDASELYVVGDLFDFWFEYKRAVPRGFTRSLGKLAELSDSGIKLHLFTGNHDLWIFDYLPEELNAALYRNPVECEWSGNRFLIGHGDGLGPGDHGYKFLKKVFSSSVLQWFFARIHPNFGIWLADRSSKYSRQHTGGTDAEFHGKENEWLYQYCCEQEATRHRQAYIFGHRHLPIDMPVGSNSRYINLGDWIHYYTYAVLDTDSGALSLKHFEGNVKTDPLAKTFGQS